MSDDLSPRGARSHAARWLGWIASPTFFYLLAFLLNTALVLSLFNPHWGPGAGAWPHEVFLVDGNFVWGAAQAQAAAILSLIALLSIALLLPSSRGRGILALFASGIALVAFQADPSVLGYWILPLATGLVGGCLLLRPQHAGRTRRAVLLVALAVLAANLFLPWDTERVAQRDLEPGYYSTATAEIDLLFHPPDDYMFELGDDEELTATPVEGYFRILMATLPALMGVVVFVLGLLALAGLAGPWMRWVAGPVLVILVLGTAWVLYNHGSIQILEGGPEPWELGLSYWSRMWILHGCAWILPLAGAVAEIVYVRES